MLRFLQVLNMCRAIVVLVALVIVVSGSSVVSALSAGIQIWVSTTNETLPYLFTSDQRLHMGGQ